MKKMQLYKLSLVLSYILVFTGAIFKIQHWPGASTILTLGYISTLVFVILGLIRVVGSKSKPLFEKILWSIGFIFFSWISGVLYYFMELREAEKF